MLRLGAALSLVLVGTLVVSGAGLWLVRGRTAAVLVDGVERSVAQGATLGDAIERFDLDPPAGDLLDVQGEILEPGVYPGFVLLNGRRAPAETELASDDRIDTVVGRSRREPTRRVFVPVAGGVPANPQFSLARATGLEVEQGRLSGKLDATTALPSGLWRRPRAVALTFDDGPSPHTRRILAILRRLDAPATFFVVGASAERYPGLVRRAHAYGMAIGNHSYSHPYRPPFDRRSRSEIENEIARGAEAIGTLAAPPTLFRPPGGVLGQRVVDAARDHDQRTVLWSVDAEDWRPRTTAREIVERVLADVRPGSIVLLHDGGGDRARTAEALPRIVRGIRARGLRLVVVEPARSG